jgi:hypothetical protein
MMPRTSKKPPKHHVRLSTAQIEIVGGLCGSFAVQSHLSIGDNRDVPPVLDKLHYLLSGSSDRGPSRLSFWILPDTDN